MAIVQSKVYYNGSEYELSYTKNDVQCYVNKNDTACIIADKHGEFLFFIEGSNDGELSIDVIE